MVEDAFLTKETFHVLQRVPVTWWDERDVVDGIATALAVSATKVRGSLQHLIQRRLVERRTRHTIAPMTEVRKVGR